MNNHFSHRICIAPMLGYTDRHYHFLMRLITKHTRLYTGMFTTQALLRGKKNDLLSFHEIEHPIALQLAGNQPLELAQCAKLAQKTGYDEINFNIGCPSDRAQAGNFGACLMQQPELIVQCMQAMIEAVHIPVSIKMRLGVQNNFIYDEWAKWIEKLFNIGCKIFIIHARNANLKTSPKKNRKIPVLNYEAVYRLKRMFTDAVIVINGNITTQEEMHSHLKQIDGVMIGRAAYRNPYLFSAIDQDFFQDSHKVLSRPEIIDQYHLYMKEQVKKGISFRLMERHLMGLFYGIPGARIYRKTVGAGLVPAQKRRPQGSPLQ